MGTMEISQELDLSTGEAAGNISAGVGVRRCPGFTGNFSSSYFTDKGEGVRNGRNNQEYPD